MNINANKTRDFVTSLDTKINIDSNNRIKVATMPALYDLISGTISAVNGTVPVNVDCISNVMIHCKPAPSVVGHNATFEGSLDSTDGSNGNWFGLQAIRSNSNTIESTSGALSAAPAYSWEMSVNALKWIRVKASAHTSGAMTWMFQPGSYATEPIPGIQTHAITGTVTANQGTLTSPTPLNVTSAATTNATIVKSSAGTVYSITASNTSSTTTRYLKFYNIATSPVVGTTIPVLTITLPALTEKNISFGVLGHRFATGIGMAITTGSADTDATVVVAGEVKVCISFI